MTREEELANNLWYYIRQYGNAVVTGKVDQLTSTVVNLHTEILRALRSKKK